MTTTKKMELLTRSIWTYSECKDYLQIKTEYAWRKFVTSLKPCPFSRRVSRDEVMRVTGTTVDKELEILKKVGK